jgi:hypothetical protein
LKENFSLLEGALALLLKPLFLMMDGASAGSILTGAGIGTAAAALIAGFTGDRRIDVAELLGGAGVGAAGGPALGNRQTEAIVVNPNEDLTLELRSDLALRERDQ